MMCVKLISTVSKPLIVGEGTCVIEVFTTALVAVSSGGDVEIAIALVNLHHPVDATRISLLDLPSEHIDQFIPLSNL